MTIVLQCLKIFYTNWHYLILFIFILINNTKITDLAHNILLEMNSNGKSTPDCDAFFPDHDSTNQNILMRDGDCNGIN